MPQCAESMSKYRARNAIDTHQGTRLESYGTIVLGLPPWHQDTLTWTVMISDSVSMYFYTRVLQYTVPRPWWFTRAFVRFAWKQPINLALIVQKLPIISRVFMHWKSFTLRKLHNCVTKMAGCHKSMYSLKINNVTE